MYIVIGNFGNHSLAALQFLLERDLANIHFISVDTGWAASGWDERVIACMSYAQTKGVTVHRLKPQASFSALVQARNNFPSRKFQWCASFLKGMPILNCLDEIDVDYRANIISGKRGGDSRKYSNLQEFSRDDEFYQGRTVWYPLWNIEEEVFIQLIQRTGFSVLAHPSLECSPCVHTHKDELSRLDSIACERLENLEQLMDQYMFEQPISFLTTHSEIKERKPNLTLQQFERGCGSPWGCGE